MAIPSPQELRRIATSTPTQKTPEATGKIPSPEELRQKAGLAPRNLFSKENFSKAANVTKKVGGAIFDKTKEFIGEQVDTVTDFAKGKYDVNLGDVGTGIKKTAGGLFEGTRAVAQGLNEGVARILKSTGEAVVGKENIDKFGNFIETKTPFAGLSEAATGQKTINTYQTQREKARDFALKNNATPNQAEGFAKVMVLGSIFLDEPFGGSLQGAGKKAAAEIIAKTTDKAVIKNVLEKELPKTTENILETMTKILEKETDADKVDQFLQRAKAGLSRTVIEEDTQALAKRAERNLTNEVSDAVDNSLKKNATGVREKSLEYFRANPDEINKTPIKVREVDGKLSIEDGRHRLQVAEEKGIKVDIEDVTPEYTGKKSALVDELKASVETPAAKPDVPDVLKTPETKVLTPDEMRAQIAEASGKSVDEVFSKKEKAVIEAAQAQADNVKRPIDPRKPEHNDFEDALKIYVDKKANRVEEGLKIVEEDMAKLAELEKQVKDIPRQYNKRTPEQQALYSRYNAYKENMKRNQAFYDFYHRADAAGKNRLESLRNPSANQIAEYKNQWLKDIKKAISQGYDIDQNIINKYPELQKAATARARYEKGWKTSFANKSAGINEQTKQDFGFKVKRQDGKPITQEQIKEITESAQDLEKAIGEYKDIVEKLDLTVAHTSGKYPFLRGDAGGVYHGKEKTISIGLGHYDPKIGELSTWKAFAHEMFHAFDDASGTMGKMVSKHFSRGGEYDEKLISIAKQKMNGSSFQIERAMKLNPKMTDEEKLIAKMMRASLTGYYRTSPEIFARLNEQYVAEKIGKNLSTNTPEYYRGALGYWDKETFDEMKPMIEAELKKKVALAREKLGITEKKGFGQFKEEAKAPEITKDVPRETPKTKKEYKTIHQGGEIKMVEGEPVKIVDGVETFVHKGDGGWVVSEASTGRFLADGKTTEEAISNTKAKIKSVGKEKFLEMIDKNKLPQEEIKKTKAVKPKEAVADLRTAKTSPEAVKEAAEDVNREVSGIEPDGTTIASKTVEGVPPIKKTPNKASKLAQNKEASFEVPPETRLAYIQRILQDKMNRLGNVQKAIVKKKGIPLAEDVDAYLQQELFIGRAAERIDNFERKVIMGKDKKSILQKMADDKIDVEKMGEYLQAEHAIERNKKIAEINPDIKDGGSGMTNAKAKEILANADPKYAEYAKQIRENITEARLKILEDEGLMTPEAIEKIRSAYKNYVPLKVAQEKTFFLRGSSGFSTKGKDVFRAKGSLKDRTNPLVQAIMDYEDTVIKAEKNKVSKTLKKLIEENPNPKLWEVKAQQYKPVFNKDGEVEYMIPKEFQLAENVLEVREGGKIFHITINDKALAAGMRNLGTERGVKLLNTINGYLRAVNTFYSPEFVITNFERDIQAALVNVAGEQGYKHAGNVLKDLRKAMQGVYRETRGKVGKMKGDIDWTAEYKELKETGGRVGFFNYDDVLQRTDDIIKKIRRYSSDKKLDSFMRGVDGVGEMISNVNESVESAVRLSAYVNAKRAGLSKEKAAQIAKNLTVNFNKKGTWGTALNSLYLFSNAGIQGTARIFTALKHKRTRKIVAGIAAFAYLTNEVNNQINPEGYDKVSDDEKRRNYIFMLPKELSFGGRATGKPLVSVFGKNLIGVGGDNKTGFYIKVAMPYGYNIFKTLGDTAFNTIHSKKTVAENIKDVFLAADSAFNPLQSGSIIQTFTPTFLDPIVQVAENKNFAGNPIIPEQGQYEAKKPMSELYFRSVRKSSKAVTDWLNSVTGGSQAESGAISISPEHVDHIVDFLSGGLGKFLSNNLDTGVSIFKGDVPEVSNTPFLRKILGETYDQVEKSKVYDVLDKSQTRPITDTEKENFKKYLKESVELGDFDEKKAVTLTKQLVENQSRIKAARILEDVKSKPKEERKAYLKSLDISGSVEKELIKLLKENAKK